MSSLDYARDYNRVVNDLLARLPRDTALREAIGSNFEAVGRLEMYLLQSLGLSAGHFVVDVGCGSGRLAVQLAQFSRLRYLGTDVVTELLRYAKQLSNRPDWKFVETSGVSIPLEADTADFVCFFSVFTHLLHEDSYRYLQDSYRVLKPGGKVVFSFLEFRIPCHWEIFQDSVTRGSAGRHLNQFMDRDAIAAWAQHLGFTVEAMHDGDKPHFPIPEVVCWETGQRMERMGNLGQSIAVLAKSPCG